jgi:hypothetical protein
MPPDEKDKPPVELPAALRAKKSQAEMTEEERKEVDDWFTKSLFRTRGPMWPEAGEDLNGDLTSRPKKK